MDRGIGLVFPGQGSQSVGMLDKFIDESEVVRTTLEEASEAIGFDMTELMRNGPEDALNRTVNTQPALLAASVAIWRAWRGQGGPGPVALSGHSLGEYSALVCAGVLAFADAVRLVAERGRCMQAATPEDTGAMAAVLGLDDARLEEVCREAAGGETVEPANFNSPGQTVIAGHRGAVQRAAELAKSAGARRAILLPVSVPSHCALMFEAAQEFRATLDGIPFADAEVPVIQNVDAKAHTSAGAIKAALVDQMYRPVRWSECVAVMVDMGAGRFLECGPGRVLSGLLRRINSEIECAVLGTPDDMASALEAVRS